MKTETERDRDSDEHKNDSKQLPLPVPVPAKKPTIITTPIAISTATPVIAILPDCNSGDGGLDPDPDPDREDPLCIPVPSKSEFRCPNPGCGETCKSAVGLVLHARSHWTGLCDLCGFQLPDSSDTAAHVADFHVAGAGSPHSANPFTCAKCGKTSKSALAFRRHVRESHRPTPFTCPVPACQFEFTRPENLKTHMTTHHSAREQNPKLCTCKTCGQTFTLKTSLKRHVQYLHRDRRESYACKFCDKVYGRPDSLRNHVRTQHDPSRPKYICQLQECGREFKTRCHLRRHAKNLRHSQEVKVTPMTTTTEAKADVKVNVKVKIWKRAATARARALPVHAAASGAPPLKKVKLSKNPKLPLRISPKIEQLATAMDENENLELVAKKIVKIEPISDSNFCKLRPKSEPEPVDLDSFLLPHSDDDLVKTEIFSSLEYLEPSQETTTTTTPTTTPTFFKHVNVHSSPPIPPEAEPDHVHVTTRSRASSNDNPPNSKSRKPAAAAATSSSRALGHGRDRDDAKFKFWCMHCDSAGFSTQRAVQCHEAVCGHEAQLKVKVKNAADDKPFACKFCNKTFKSAGTLKHHVAKHSDLRPYACAFCPSTFKWEQTKRVHERAVHFGKKYVPKMPKGDHRCTHVGCDTVLSTLKSMRRHEAEVHVRTYHTCRVQGCKKKYVRQALLAKHVKLVHAVDDGTRYWCKVCDKEFKREDLFKTHFSRPRHLRYSRTPKKIKFSQKKQKRRRGRKTKKIEAPYGDDTEISVTGQKTEN